MHILRYFVIASAVTLSGTGTGIAGDPTLISRVDLCGANDAIQELEDVTWLAPTWVDDHYISCNWAPALDFCPNRPQRQARQASCMDGVGEWMVGIVFETVVNDAVKLTSADERLPRKTYGACPAGQGQPVNAHERALKLDQSTE